MVSVCYPASLECAVHLLQASQELGLHDKPLLACLSFPCASKFLKISPWKTDSKIQILEEKIQPEHSRVGGIQTVIQN